MGDLAYLIGHTTSPACLVPPNMAARHKTSRIYRSVYGATPSLHWLCKRARDRPRPHFRVILGVKAVAIIRSETGSVYFDPQRAGEDVSQLVNLVMMGDGAAAIIVGPDDSRSGAHISRNFFGQVGRRHTPGFTLRAGGSDEPFIEGGAVSSSNTISRRSGSGG